MKKLLLLMFTSLVMVAFVACDSNYYESQIDSADPYISNDEVCEDDEVAEEVVEIVYNISLEQRIAELMETRRYGGNRGLRQDHIRGLAISVFTQDDMILEMTYGYANTETGLLVDADTVFEWGSITKLLVYVSAMQLYEQGKLDLHADIFTYIQREDFPNIIYPITLHQLMHHSAGFNDAFDFEFMALTFGMPGEPVPTLESVLMEASASGIVRQRAVPGEHTWYGNYSTALAGYVVESVAGVPFYEYVHSNIFAPLGMYHTALRPDMSDNEWVLQQRDKIAIYGTRDMPFDHRMQILVYPAGAAVGTISDLVRFARAILPDENGESILFANAETLAKLHPTIDDILNAPVCELGRTIFFNGFAVSLEQNNDLTYSRVIGHSGIVPGFISHLFVDIDRGVGMVMSENTGLGISVGGRRPDLLFYAQPKHC